MAKDTTNGSADHLEQVEIDHEIYLLLKRAAIIEGRKEQDILLELLLPYLRRYRYESLEEWEEARELEEFATVITDMEQDEHFDPNAIPFDKSILGLRKTIDDIEKEISANTESRQDLENLRFSILAELNFAEKEALRKQQEKRQQKIQAWKNGCKEIPLKPDE